MKASKSGKLDNSILEEFYSEVCSPGAGEYSLLLVHFWSANSDRSLVDRARPTDKEIDILSIPPGTTWKVQPLDVYGFRSWKQFARFFSDRVLIDDLDVILNQRNELIKLQSLIHNQMSSRGSEKCGSTAGTEPVTWMKSHFLFSCLSNSVLKTPIVLPPNLATRKPVKICSSLPVAGVKKLSAFLIFTPNTITIRLLSSR